MDEWETSKENSAPLIRGRNAAALSSALKAKREGKMIPILEAGTFLSLLPYFSLCGSLLTINLYYID